LPALYSEPPAFVQNRCFARTGWDRDVRLFCARNGTIYQGFSLLTANLDVLRHPVISRMAAHYESTPAQIVFRFAQIAGMLPITGTSDESHMKQDLAGRLFDLTVREVQAIEGLGVEL